jgi:nicotinate-nucleotide adenylyltransferase
MSTPYNENIRRVGIYGGTFAPPHVGHVEAAKAFMKQMRLDYLYVIPAAIPPHKQCDFIVDPMHRLAMCDLAFSGIDGVIVSDLELRRGGVSYTVDTLRKLTAPDTRLFLFCGTDMFLTLDQWYQADEIFKLCYPIYIRRENDQLITNKILKKIGEYTEKYNAVVRRVVTDPIELSSSRVRKTIAEGGDISGMVDPKVKMYIEDHGLFR